ncbi:MAG: DUF6067 family protein [Clostridiales bacterium]|jgi:hypothetical protein|nr:DUF6067 family protein [Clostridiales bacterium]
MHDAKHDMKHGMECGMKHDAKHGAEYDMKKERELLRWVESDAPMSAAEMEEFLARRAGDGFFAAAEDRSLPYHDIEFFPARWLSPDFAPREFRGCAQPGEYYAFQVVLYSERAVGPVAASWEGNAPAPDCFNLGGADCLGRKLAKEVFLRPREAVPFWFGVAVPDGRSSPIEGALTVFAGEGAPGRTQARIDVRIDVRGEALADCGDSEPWRHSRLRWLNSGIAIDDKITAPFTPLRVRGKTVSGLGHSVALGDDGLPAGIRSFFAPTNEYVSQTPTEILAAPAAFAAKMAAPGASADVASADAARAAPARALSPLRFTRESDGIVAWESAWQAGDLQMRLEGSMEYDGYLQYSVDVTASRDAEIEDIALSLPFSTAASKYWMGLDRLGGLRKGGLDWKWDPALNQDTLWMGDVNAGLMVRLKDRTYEKPYMLIYYHYSPLKIPKAWDNGGAGGVTVRGAAGGSGDGSDGHGGGSGGAALFAAYSGKRSMRKGETLNFMFDLAITPVKPINKEEHWHDHYYHAVPEDWRDVAAKGCNVVNLHHANRYNPYINYPFFETRALAGLVEEGHRQGARTKLYYTVKEITVHAVEFWAFQSLGDEIIPSAREIGGSFQGSVPYADEWMARHIRKNYMAAWRQKINSGPYRDELEASVVAAPMSRFNNYFLEGLQWLLDRTGMDGLYFDDAAFDRTVMKRLRKILDRHHPGCTVDLHSWNYFRNNTCDDSSLAGYANSMNLYIDSFAFIDRIWFGEGFDYAVPPDAWLVEISGIPFGMMGEMLQDGGNIWRGMLFGMSNRAPNERDPSGLWRFWRSWQLRDAVLVGFWNGECPVRADSGDVRATVYRRPGACVIALASWACEERLVRLSVDYAALGIDPQGASLCAPAIEGFQEEREFSLDGAIPVPAGKGWLIALQAGNA